MPMVVTPYSIGSQSDASQQLRDGSQTGVFVTQRQPACFRGDERLRCRDVGCRWRAQCRRLIAAWRR